MKLRRRLLCCCVPARLHAWQLPYVRPQALLASSHLYHEVQKNAASHGVIVDGARIDIGKMMAQKDKAVSGLTKGVEGLFKKYKARHAAAPPLHVLRFLVPALECRLGRIPECWVLHYSMKRSA